MAATQRLELRQSQSLVMTPQLQQAIKLLQLSNLEVSAFVERELEQNPLLERDEAQALGPQDPESAIGGGETRGETGLGEVNGSTVEGEPLSDSFDHSGGEMVNGNDAPLDADYSNNFDSDLPAQLASGPAGSLDLGGRGGGSPSGFDEGPQLEQQLRAEISLREHLLDQLHLSVSDPVDRLIGAHLIDLLDESGYITEDLGDLADVLGCDVTRVESALRQIQNFDPTGIGARSLGECLALQLKERNRYDPAIEALLANLNLVAEGRMAELTRLCGVDMEDLRDMLAELKALDPKPALAFDDGPAQALIPDIMLRALPSGKWLVELNSDSLPRVLVNESYYHQVSSRSRTKQDLEYLADRFQSANWLVKALHQRATTILKVASEIVRQQDGFFRKGISHLKPLTLKDIAEVVEMHESTVSRVTSNKFMVTPRGTFELKYFFSASIGASDGGSHSAESVRHKIRHLIDQESAKRVLSDDSIVDILRKDGVEIARRTVAKYREAMRIPSSVERRRQKASRF